MRFVRRELHLIQGLLSVAEGERYARLYAAQEAFAWSLEPSGFMPPVESIEGIPEDSEDCSARNRLPSS
jgi:hypothetical protein